MVNQIVVSDALEFLKGLPDETANLMVSSPPYNLKNTSGGGLKNLTKNNHWNKPVNNWYDSHNDAMPNDEYIAWQRAVLQEALRVIKSDGAIFYNHKWRVQSGLLQNLAGEILKGFPVQQIIIWNRGSGMNFNDGYFIPTYEEIYLIVKPAFRLNPKMNVYGDIWNITPERDSKHPAPFPIDIPIRCISAASKPNDLVIDPFAGSGTTPRAAQLLGRNFMACDLSPRYVEMAQARIEQPFTVPMFGD